MSRIGKKPVAIPDGVSVECKEGVIHVKGPKGELSERVPEGIRVEIGDGEVRFQRADDRKQNRALHGLARALVANMVKGVTESFSRDLEIQGVGYRADVDGRNLNLQLGFSHPIRLPIPEGLTVSVERAVALRIQGISCQQVGQFAAEIRALRPPEPYKGKGVRYAGEHVRRKVGKAGVTST